MVIPLSKARASRLSGLAALALLLLVPACGGQRPERPLPTGNGERPDLILLSIDTLRADHLGCYGYERDTSPFLDSLAGRGTWFTQAWAPTPWTLPSHATLLSGLLPLHHGAEEEQHAITTAAPMIAEALAAAGYGTCGVVTSIFVSARYGFARGFQHFHDFGVATGDSAEIGTPDADDVFAHALQWAAEQPDGRPLFLFLHVYDVHYPYDAPPPWNERFNRPARPEELHYENYYFYLQHPLTAEQLAQQMGQYDEEIAYVDDALRRFYRTWTASRRNTVLLVTADHGEEFGERGSWGHAHTLTPEQLHVPWLVTGAGVRRQRIDQRVGLEDMAPTLAGLAALPGDVRARFATDGVDRSDQIRRGAPAGEDRVAARFASTCRRHTLEHRWHEPPYDLIFDLPHLEYHLYDLSADPQARRDVLQDHLARARELNDDMYAWLGQPWEAVAAGTVQSDGLFVVDGQRQNQEMAVTAGRRFALFPPDARLTWRGPDGAESGPWQALGGELPSPDDPALRWHGPLLESETRAPDELQQQRLRSLGY